MSKYTEEDLKGMSRVELRRAAIEVLKVDNKAVSNEKSADLIAKILEAQEGGGKPKGGGGKPAGGRGRAPATGSSKPKEDQGNEGDAGGEQEKPRGGSAQGGGGGNGDLAKRIDAVGKTVDDNHNEVKELLAEIDRKNFVIFGLLVDLFKTQVGGPDELEERLNALQEEYEGSGEQGNES